MTSTAENSSELTSTQVPTDDGPAGETPAVQASDSPTSTDPESTDPASDAPESTDPESESDEIPSLTAEETRFIRWAVEAAVGRKAESVMVLYLAKISDFTDHFMICSGTNERQVQAITDGIVRSLREHGLRPLHVEGQRQGKWVLIDYGGEMVIHVFQDETRQFYALERLWGDAPNITQQILDSLDGEASPPQP